VCLSICGLLPPFVFVYGGPSLHVDCFLTLFVFVYRARFLHFDCFLLLQSLCLQVIQFRIGSPGVFLVGQSQCQHWQFPSCLSHCLQVIQFRKRAALEFFLVSQSQCQLWQFLASVRHTVFRSSSPDCCSPGVFLVGQSSQSQAVKRVLVEHLDGGFLEFLGPVLCRVKKCGTFPPLDCFFFFWTSSGLDFLQSPVFRFLSSSSSSFQSSRVYWPFLFFLDACTSSDSRCRH
jgi:hypothetical protein